MIKGTIQKQLYNELIKNGKIENIGREYRRCAKSASRTSNTTIKNFINSVCEKHKNVRLELGKRGGLETAILILKEEE